MFNSVFQIFDARSTVNLDDIGGSALLCVSRFVVTNCLSLAISGLP